MIEDEDTDLMSNYPLTKDTSWIVISIAFIFGILCIVGTLYKIIQWQTSDKRE